MRGAFDSDLVEEIERKRRITAGDFGRALDTYWLTLKVAITHRAMYRIVLRYLGAFAPIWLNVKRAIKKEIKRISDGKGSRDRLYDLLQVRRRLIRAGQAPKSYYIRKTIINGKTEDERRRAKSDLKALHDRCEWLNKAHTGRQNKRRDYSTGRD